MCTKAPGGQLRRLPRALVIESQVASLELVSRNRGGAICCKGAGPLPQRRLGRSVRQGRSKEWGTFSKVSV
jgi:hypothetical protein